MGGLAAAFSIGCRSLRHAEDFFADLDLGAQRALGLGRGKPCDTTLYRLLAEQSPAGLEKTVLAQVKDLIARKVVRNDLLALGVVSFDGKGTWSRTDGEKVKGAQQSAYDAEGSSLQTFGALRAALTSSSVCPCVGQRLISSSWPPRSPITASWPQLSPEPPARRPPPSSLRADSMNRPAADAAGRPASRRLDSGATAPAKLNSRQRGSGLPRRGARLSIPVSGVFHETCDSVPVLRLRVGRLLKRAAMSSIDASASGHFRIGDIDFGKVMSNRVRFRAVLVLEVVTDGPRLTAASRLRPSPGRGSTRR